MIQPIALNVSGGYGGPWEGEHPHPWESGDGLPPGGSAWGLEDEEDARRWKSRGDGKAVGVEGTDPNPAVRVQM